MDARAGNTTLVFDDTVQSAVVVNRLVFGGGNTLALEQQNSGRFTFGGAIDVVSGTNNIFSRSAVVAVSPLTATSLTFVMDDATAGSTLLDAGGRLRRRLPRRWL